MFIGLMLLFVQAEAQINFDFSGKEPKAKEIKISSIASSIDYVVLETTPQTHISRIFRVVRVPGHFLVWDAGAMEYVKLFIFREDGSFRSLIHAAGKGPGEYVGIDDFTYNKQSKTILILNRNQQKVLEFDLDGVFIKETKLLFRATKISYLNSGHYAFAEYLRYIKPDENGDRNILMLTNDQFEVVKKFPSSIDYQGGEKSPWIVSPDLYTLNGELRYRQPNVDSLYTLDQELNLVPLFTFDFGVYRPPVDIRSSFEKFRSERHRYKELAGIFELPRHYLVAYLYDKAWSNVLVEKEGGSRYMAKGKDKRAGFVNDFDGNLPLNIRSFQTDQEFFCYYDAIDLLTYCHENNVRKFSSDYPDQKQKLMAVLDQIDEESNPVIQVVTLK